jgi:hypothetical protein
LQETILNHRHVPGKQRLYCPCEQRFVGRPLFCRCSRRLCAAATAATTTTTKQPTAAFGGGIDSVCAHLPFKRFHLSAGVDAFLEVRLGLVGTPLL